jgi:hypothetical protein
MRCCYKQGKLRREKRMSRMCDECKKRHAIKVCPQCGIDLCWVCDSRVTWCSQCYKLEQAKEAKERVG